MKKIFLLLLLIASVLVGCDGRQSSRERLEKAVSEYNKKQTKIDIVTYYPKQYTEVKTDSIIANTFKVSIKNYAVMTKNVLIKEVIKNEHKKTEYHRVFESEIMVYNGKESIFKTRINAKQFKEVEPSEFWDNATLEHVWVNQETSSDKLLNLEISFIDPQTKSYKLYQLSINNKGQEHINLLKENS